MAALDTPVLEHIPELLPDPYAVRRLRDDVIVAANEAFAEQVGRPVEEIVGSRLGKLSLEMDPEGRKRYRDMLREEGEVRDFKLNYRGARDEERIILLSSRIVERGGERYNVTVSKDITGEVAARRELERQESQYRQLFERNVAGSFRTTLSGQILEVNEAFAELFGYESADAMEGMDVRELYACPEKRSGYMEELSKEPSPPPRELELERKDGETIWVLEASFLTRDRAIDEMVNVGTLVDITERKRLEQELAELAYRDPLTGVANRRLLTEQGRKMLARLDREGDRGALLFVDLRRFKRINDTFGHETGDNVLAQVGLRLRASIREADVVGRVGGDEFVVLLHEVASAEDAVDVARTRIHGVFDEPFEVSSRRIPLDATIGLALYPDHGSSMAELLARADEAMYGARRHGSPSSVWLASEGDGETPDVSG